MSDLDEIRKRLDKLKDFNDSVKKQDLTDEELHQRLKILKGFDVNDGAIQNSKQNFFLPVTKFKSEAEEADNLFQELCDEVEINDRIKGRSENEEDQIFANLSTNKADGFDFSFNDQNFVSKSYDRTNKNNKILSQKELETELGFLKKNMNNFNYQFKDLSKNNPSSSNQSNTQIKNLNNQFDQLTTETSTDEESEEKFVGIVKQFVNEAELEKLTESNEQKDEDNFKIDKFDFCYICNEDAVVECNDCDDRFCLKCFKEFHQDPEYREHSYTKFKIP